MIWIIYVLASIGGLITGVFGYLICAELVRAIRQGHRISTAIARAYDGRRKPSVRAWRLNAVREFGRSYTTVEIGPYVLPHDPSKRARHSRW